MSSTRRVKAGERRTQNGWASAVEFEDLHGLNGNRVASKAALLGGLTDAERKRQLLLFLQALSLREGGIRRIVRELLEIFPHKVGTPTMVKVGCRPGKRLTQADLEKINGETYPVYGFDKYLRTGNRERLTTAGEAYAECLEIAESRLGEFIERLCCDPRLAVTENDEEL